MKKLIFASLLAAPLLQAQDSGTMRLFGSNELLVERFDITGNRAFSPFRFEDTAITNRLNLNVDWKQGAGRNFTIRADVLGGDNPYLADDGLVLERLTLEYENGTLAVPFRLTLGDLFADFSRRTLSRSVRGVSLEFQPAFGGGDQSIVIVAGNGEPGWRDTFDDTATDLAFSGVSYLASTASGNATFVANFVDARQKPSVTGAVPIPVAFNRDQQIGGLYGEFRLAGGVIAEGEVSFLTGDGEIAAPAATRRETDGTSFYVQVARPEARRFDWRIRLEQNGEDFLPVGGVGIIANRRNAEAQGRARLGGRNGMLHGRLQFITDGFEGAFIERETRTAGIGWDANPAASRPMFFIRASGDLQEIETDDRLVDVRFQNYLLEVSDRPGPVDLRYRLSFRAEDDEVQSRFSRRLTDHDLSVGRSFSGPRASGNLRAGVIYRVQDRSGQYDSWSPLLDLFVRRGSHSLRMHLGFLSQDFEPATVEDLRYDTRQMVYAFNRGRHAIALEWGVENRRPESSTETTSQRYALRYRLAFDRSL
jgi:hypothetical protein